MNKERMLELAELLENANPKHFHLGSWFGFHNQIRWSPVVSGDIKLSDLITDTNNQIGCGTTACIAGWAIAMKYNFNAEHTPKEEIGREAAEYLGITEEQMYRLFYADEDSIWAELQEDYGFEVGERDVDGYYQEFDCQHWNVSNKDAAHIIKKIVSGQIEL